MDLLQRLDFISLRPNFKKELWLLFVIDLSFAKSLLDGLLLVINKSVQHDLAFIIDERDFACDLLNFFIAIEDDLVHFTIDGEVLGNSKHRLVS